MIEKPNGVAVAGSTNADALSNVLRAIRLSGSLQFCFMPTGDWQTDPEASLSSLLDGSSHVMPFHIVVEGTCWLSMDGRQIPLAAGDVVAFPFASPHDLGAGQ